MVPELSPKGVCPEKGDSKKAHRAPVRQAGTRDLGPFAAVLTPAYTPLLELQIQRHYRDPKITAHMSSGDKL